MSEPQIGFVQVQCTDMEDYARIFNEGFDEARRQSEADVRTAGARALKDAAAEQRRLAEESRTNNGQAEHEDIADWLEERADEIPGRSLHCPVGCDDGACETCPCCSAGFCVYGLDGLPEDPEDVGRWLEVAAGHNPVAALLKARVWSVDGAEGGERDEAGLGVVMSDEQGLGTCSPEPAAVITDEAEGSVARALYPDLFAIDSLVPEALRVAGRAQRLREVREALKAAVPLLGPRVLLDRKAVKAVLDRRLHGEQVVDMLLELARPMPTSERIAQAIRGHDALGCGCCGFYDFDRYEDRAAAIADTVLALLKGGQS
jgi:hypothetical protein